MTQKTPDFSQRDLVRVTAVQMEMRRVDSFDAFMAHIEYFVDNASAYKSDFVVFPELFTLPLLGLSETRLPASGAVEWLTQYTERFTEGLRDFAMDYKINIIGGSHLTLTEAGENR